MRKLFPKAFFLFAFLLSAIVRLNAQNDLDQKLMMGYQGWFLCQGDNSAPNEWRHWFQSLTDPSISQLNVDMWPDMTEYTTTYATNMSYPNGTNARLFSSHDASTTNLHFKWMQDYNIYGVYLQRFLGEAANDQRFFQVRNNVLQNVINASSTYGRHFSIMYDLSGVPDDGNLYNKLIADWEHLVNTYNVTNRTGYVKQNGMPVLAIWGIGFRDRGLRPETFQQIINYFHNTAAPQYRAYIVGGVPDSWRTLNNDSESDPRWLDIYRSLDMISPWAVGRYGNVTEADNWKTNKIIPDMNDCNANGVDYMPVIFPGFSWYNMHDGAQGYPLNQIPRAGGNFYWRQAYNTINAGAKYVYVAMFDEVDEGTAMFKLAATNAQAPSGASMVTMDEDGQSLPGDWYLRLANETQKMLDGTIPLTSTIPISPNNNAPVVTSSGTANATIGSPFTYTITATNSPTSYSTSGLPAGLSLNPSTGVISGTPSGPSGNFNSTITATNSVGSGNKTLTFTVSPSTPVTGMPANPFIKHMYTADPSAHVWADGRLYVYPSTDIAPPRGADLMDQYHVFSTDDMVNWTDHGEILRASNVPWGRPEGGFMWAPDCAYKNGTYYFYFPHPSGTEWNTTWKIGIATSSSPASGFTVQGFIPGIESHIDPCVFIDDDGQAYFYYGGGGVAKGGRMKSNMMEIDGAMENMTGLVDFHEASWVHKRNGIYYLSYSDNHDVGDSHNQMRYATSNSPLGPWTHRGIYMDPTDSYTNHGSIVEYKGQSYAFYHNSALSGNDWLRSICVDKLFYNGDGTIQKVIQTKGHGTPYGGTARAIPGTIQAEDYDLGGPGLAYSDDALNSGGQYRPNEGVDIEVCGEGGFNVGWINNGEWLEYTVNVTNAGTHTINLRVAAETASAIQVEFDGIDKTGVMTVPATGAWQTYTTINKSITLAAGQQIMRVLMRGGAFNFNYVNLTFDGGIPAPVISSSGTASGTAGQAFNYTITASNSPTSYGASGLPSGVSVNTSTGVISGTPTTAGTYNATITATNAGGTGSKALTITINSSTTQTPYLGVIRNIPGTIQAEDYDEGGEGIAYHDIDATNTGGQYRNPDGVDIEVCSEGGWNVGWMRNTEWLEYTVSVVTSGAYNLNLRVATPLAGRTMHVEMDGVQITGTITLPNTGGWQNWQTVSVAIPSLSAGTRVLRIGVDSDDFNLNYMNFSMPGNAPVVTNTSLPSGTVNSSYNTSITATNNPTSYGALGLPSGLSVNTSTGVISGTPTASGTFTVTLSATNATGTGTKVLSLVVNPANPPAPVVSNTSLPSGTVNAAYSTTITASNNPTSYGASGLPAGLSVNTSSGVISGTPTASGTFTVTLSATNASGTGTKQLSLVINPASTGIPVINNSSLAAGSVGTTYSVSISATNSPTSYGASGLPAGLSVNTSTGVISGTPTETGSFSVGLSATNASGTGSKTLTLSVTEPAGISAVYRTPGAITVNGSLTESGWNLVKTVSINTVGTGNNTVKFAVMWDNTNLYVGVRVLDANLFSDSPNAWEDDAVEIYIDANNNKLTSYDGSDNQIIKNYNKSTVFTKFALTGLQHSWAAVTGGYSVEIAIPWTQLGFGSTPAAGTKIGFDVGYDDDDNGGVRDAQAVWNGTVNNYQNTSAFGTVVLSSASRTGTARMRTEELASETEVENTISYWPNEVKDVLHILTDGTFESVEIVDLIGRHHISEPISGMKEVSLDVTTLTGGLHIVRMRGRDSNYTFRILKKK